MRVVVTQGKPDGIGPEIVVKALAGRPEWGEAGLTVLGDPDLFRRVAADLGLPPPSRIEPVPEPFDLAALEEAARRAAAGEVDAVVTAPVNKADLKAAGFTFPGQTEFFAARLRAPDHAMMLARGDLRVVPVTTHVALRDVAPSLSEADVRERVLTVHRSLAHDFGIDAPRIAVLGLNPHAGEEGHFGDEEERVIYPAVRGLRADGIEAEGPLPADAAFAPRRRSRFDAIVGMYHDQVLAPFKALAAGGGVNVTIGLPVVRTSPDHGTAEDIAGRGVADPGSLVAALELAVEVAERRQRKESA
jgi:4-hydroxythreonine-4-phosphate dehydrogenase